jgi:hypothetical protein
MWKKIAPVGFSPGPTPTKDFDIDNFLAEIDHGVKVRAHIAVLLFIDI